LYITTVPNRGSPPAILLRETYRDGGKVKNRTLANLTKWMPEKIAALRAVLRDETLAPVGDGFEILRALPHGHVAAVLGIARRLGLDPRVKSADLIPSGPARTRRLALAMIVARLIDPAAKLATARALDEATSSTRWARSWAWAASPSTSSIRRSTGCWRSSPGSRPSWRAAISPRARWCSTT